MIKDRQYTLDEAYKAMVQFIKEYYLGIFNDDINPMLSDIQLLGDDIPGDPASLEYWHEACEKTMGKSFGDELTALQAFDAMIEFLILYTQYDITPVTDSKSILTDLRKLRIQNLIASSAWHLWEKILFGINNKENKGYYNIW